MTDKVLDVVARARAINTIADFERLRPLWMARKTYGAEVIEAIARAEQKLEDDKMVAKRVKQEAAYEERRKAQIDAQREREEEAAEKQLKKDIEKQRKLEEKYEEQRRNWEDYQAGVGGINGKKRQGRPPSEPTPLPPRSPRLDVLPMPSATPSATPSNHRTAASTSRLDIPNPLPAGHLQPLPATVPRNGRAPIYPLTTPTRAIYRPSSLAHTSQLPSVGRITTRTPIQRYFPSIDYNNIGLFGTIPPSTFFSSNTKHTASRK